MDTEVSKYNEDYCFSDILTKDFLSPYFLKNPKWGFNGLGYVVYKRTYARRITDSITEEWWQTVARCVNGAQKIGANYTPDEARRLYDLVFNLKCNFAGRMLWQLGTPIVEKFFGNSLLNCWFAAIREPKAFLFLFENLMLGGGVGFSVRREDVHELPKVKKNVEVSIKDTKDADFIVPDSREGWINLLGKVLEAYFETGKSFSYSSILVRGAGEKIKGFGGTASGAQILKDGISQICGIFQNREGKKLRSIDVLDICNIIGSIVVAGNLRRSALICIGDPDDYLYIKAKNWSEGKVPNWRAMSNNTIYADQYSHISDDVWNNGFILDKKTGFAKGEPYGFFNLPLSQKYGRIKDGLMKDSDLYPTNSDNVEGTNPCLPEWAQVLTPNGISMLRDVKIGDKIWSKEGWTTILNKWSTGNKKVFEYKTTGGAFYGTSNHKIVSNGEKIEVGEADSLDVFTGDYSPPFDLHIQDILDGLVFGDGMIHKASNDLILLNIGQNDSDYFKSEVASLIGRKRDGVSKYGYEVVTNIKPHELVRTFDRQFPVRYLRGNKQKLVGFLRGLYSANGSVCGKRVKLKASSFDVIQSTQTALSSLGIASYYTTNKHSTVEFSNGTYECRVSYDLNISSDRAKFFEMIGFIQKYKMEKLRSIIKSVKPNYTPKINFEIFEENFISEEEVFDITVDNDSHTFWCNGVDTSNCGEISLNSYECCNLSELYLNNIDSEEELNECVSLLYKTQKAISAMPFIHEETNKIVHKNMRLGLGVTGICQSINKLEWLERCYENLRALDKEWSKFRGWPESIKLTTIKPSGSLSLLAGSTAGIHPAYSEFYIRRVRMSSSDPLVAKCRELGYHSEYVLNFDGSELRDTVVIEFPCSCTDAIITKDFDVIKQLELVKRLQSIWSDNAVSVTAYYKPEELDQIKEWLKNNYDDNIKSVSFLLHSEHGFKQAPYEEIDEPTYQKLIKKVKPLSSMTDIGSEILDGLECSGGTCPIR